MGQVAGRVTGVLGGRQDQPRGQDEDDVEQPMAFPSTAGSYFGSHFLMCGGRFDLAKPEAYLFGENTDLDLLGSRAVPFPYASPLGSNEVHPLNLLINIRKESVRFIRTKDADGNLHPKLFQLEFTLDAECPCFVQIHFNARELFQDGEIQFAYRNKRKLHSEQFHFDIGCDQNFNNYTFDLGDWDLDELHYAGGHYFPFVIMLQTEGIERAQTQTTMCTIDPANDTSNALILKPLRQKIACDGVIYLLQEIFGIENKEQSADMGDEGGLECIICMSDVRDTVILPCRHLCICNNCADTLRYKLNNCPICRSPFRALIHLRARRQTRNQGFETVTLVEGLNGPLNHQLSLDEGKVEVVTPSAPNQEEIQTGNKKKKTHSRSTSRAVNVVINESDEEERENSSTNGECIESADGIEMKRYVPKEVVVVTHEENETPVLSNVSSRSPSPNTFATPEEIEVELDDDSSTTRSSRRNVLQVGSGHSSNGLLDELHGENEESDEFMEDEEDDKGKSQESQVISKKKEVQLKDNELK